MNSLEHFLTDAAAAIRLKCGLPHKWIQMKWLIL